MPTEAYRRLINLIDGLLAEYECEYQECLTRVNHYPVNIPGADRLAGRLEAISEHIDRLKVKRGDLIEQAEYQDSYIRKSGLLDKRSLR